MTFKEQVLVMLQQILDWQKSMDELLETKAELLNKEQDMSIIRFETDWLKADNNIKEGDRIKFLNGGELDKQQNQWVFKVEVLRTGEQKKFGLNRTNAKRMIEKYGEESLGWIGKEITVYFVDVDSPKTGKPAKGIRLRVEGTEGIKDELDEGLEKEGGMDDL